MITPLYITCNMVHMRRCTLVQYIPHFQHGKYLHTLASDYYYGSLHETIIAQSNSVSGKKLTMPYSQEQYE